ncbi:MAG: hypothetical protein ACYC2X_11565 [Coriobacteriia bacterium]
MSSGIPKQPLEAFVYVIESPSADDLYDGRTEGRMLVEAFQLAGIRNRYVLAVGREQFERAMTDDFARAAADFSAIPILHLSAHGCKDGITLTSGELIDWNQLAGYLRPANNALRNLLVVCMSSCFGAYGRVMAMQDDRDAPYFAILGHPDSPTWSVAAVAYVAFYHRLFDGSGFTQAIDAMRAASGDNKFEVYLASQDRDLWTQHMRRLRVDNVLDSLRQARNESAHKAI